jgi:N-methylhydantoinase A/oxoprolinase/acetone carboxylase beta subunit
MIRIGSDTGGTFTDLVAADGTIVKVPSTRDDPGAAVRRATAELLATVALHDPEAAVALESLAHGTTVATNALLERRGGNVTLITNEGLADVIEIARQDRPSLYDQRVDRPVPLVPRERRLEVRGRLDADGVELTPLDLGSLPPIPLDTDSIAICLLHSDRNPAHEVALAAHLRAAGHDVTASHEVSPEFREYERTVTTVINAYVSSRCRAYLRGLAPVADTVLVMTSAAGLVSAERAIHRPAALLLSGPAGGVRAGAAIAAANGYPDAITFDMGGTSTDVCLVLGGSPEPAAERSVAGLPVRLPSVDVHTIGAGGGSIARVDDGGALVVGPESAGAEPGPACYGHGGTRPTVTDANLVAGHIPPGAELPGLGRLDPAAARAALDSAGVDADGVLAVVNASMEQALRAVSVERGVDPRGLALVAFGGAGPLHACALADALEMPVVIVPPRAGVFSAVGILGAPVQIDLVESWPHPLDRTGLDHRLAALGERAAEDLRAVLGSPSRLTSFVELAVDCRYQGQSHEIRVASVEAFHAEHERRNGYARPESPIEVVALRATALVSAPVDVGDLPAVVRDVAVGPVVIAEPDCTIWVPTGWRADPGAAGALILRRVL